MKNSKLENILSGIFVVAVTKLYCDVVIRYAAPMAAIIIPIVVLTIGYIFRREIGCLAIAMCSMFAKALEFGFDAIIGLFLGVLGMIANAIVSTETAINSTLDRILDPLLDRLSDMIDPNGELSQAMSNIVYGRELGIDAENRRELEKIRL